MMNELTYTIEELEEKVEALEAAIEDASTPALVEALEEQLEDATNELQGLREDYEAQMEYDGMNAWQYNGVSQKDFY